MNFKSNRIFKFLILIFLTISFNSCKTFKAITEIPDNYVAKPSWGNEESEIKFKVVQPMQKLYAELDKFESAKIKISKIEDLENVKIPIIAKTKNPLYNTTKWIKTKNPFYNKKKWLKACLFGKCAKTKNPAYNPKKWMKTKNPLYSPNKWMSITTSLTTVQGYELNANVAGNIKLTPYEGNKFHIEVPIRTSGWITLITPVTPPLVRKPFGGKLKIEMDISVDIDENWCVKVNPNSSFKWLEKLKLDLTYGLGALEIDLSDIANPHIEKMLLDLEDKVKESIDCQEIKNDIEQQWKTRIFKIDEEFSAVAVPKKINISQLQANKDEIVIYGGIKTEIQITDDISNVQEAGKLPNLEISQPESPSVNLSLPIKIPYNYLEKEIEKQFKELAIGDEDHFLNGKVLIKSVNIFPSGKDLGIKVKFKTKTNFGLTNVKATGYFTGQLKHISIESEKKDNLITNGSKHYLTFKLNKLAFNEFGNGKDRAVISLGYNSIKKSIEEMDDAEITNEVRMVEDLLLKSLDELVINLPQDIENLEANLKFKDTEVRIKEWAFSERHLMLLLKANASIE